MRRTLLMIAAVALLLTQCRKPVVEYPTAGPANENMVSMTVTVGTGSKTDINGTTGAITWIAGDKLYVGDGSNYIGCLELKSGAGSATGTFSGSVSTTTSTTFGFYYLGSNPPAVTSGATTVEIPFGTQTGLRENLDDCHIGYGTATGKVDGTNVVLDTNPVQMTSKVAIAYFDFKENGTSDYTGAITLSGTNICNSMTVGFNGSFSGTTGTAGNAISLTNEESSQKYVMLVPPATVDEETLEFGGGATGTTKFYKGIEANKFYCVGAGQPIEVTVKPKPKFTVGMDNGKPRRVEFSPGNLQYIGSTVTWKFAEHQWDYIGGETGGGQGTNAANVDRDLFGWGCTGSQDMRTSSTGYQTNYWPYSTSKTAAESGTEEYNKNRYGYGPDYDATNEYGLTVAAKSDWGCVTGLPSAGEGKTWRTLSKDEWGYLLNTGNAGSGARTDANRFAKAKVNGVCGMLVFPDGYNGGTAIGSITGVAALNSGTASYPDADMLPNTWTSMETAGVVFLPAAGHRSGTTVAKGGINARYWSSSCKNTQFAFSLNFASGGSISFGDSDRYWGYAVRLVR